MSFFECWFGSVSEEVVQFDVCFGRYSDFYKDMECYDVWDMVFEYFE